MEMIFTLHCKLNDHLSQRLIVLCLFLWTLVDGDGDRSVNGTYTGSIANGVPGGRYHFSLSLLLWISFGRFL